MHYPLMICVSWQKPYIFMYSLVMKCSTICYQDEGWQCVHILKMLMNTYREIAFPIYCSNGYAWMHTPKKYSSIITHYCLVWEKDHFFVWPPKKEDKWGSLVSMITVAKSWMSFVKICNVQMSNLDKNWYHYLELHRMQNVTQPKYLMMIWAWWSLVLHR